MEIRVENIKSIGLLWYVFWEGSILFYLIYFFVICLSWFFMEVVSMLWYVIWDFSFFVYLRWFEKVEIDVVKKKYYIYLCIKKEGLGEVDLESFVKLKNLVKKLN